MQMTNDRPIHRPNYKWKANKHFNWPMVSQYDVIFIGNIKRFSNYKLYYTKISDKKDYYSKKANYL